MKLLDKIKNAIFEEEEEFDEDFVEDVPKKKIVRDEEDEEIRRKFRRKALEERFKAEEEQKKKEEVTPLEDDLVKQIDVEKTIPKRNEVHVDDNPAKAILEQPVKEFPKRESRRTPIIFNDEDFDDSVEEVKKPKTPVLEEKKSSKTLYGGYREDGTKEKFRPSPNISPVYGLVEVSPVLNKNNHKAPKENHVYVPKKQDDVSLDEVRQKAFGNEPYFEEDDDLGLLYDMKEDDRPAISKVTLGDAEEYFDDLGLEYNVDYTDKKPSGRPSRSVKNEELSNKVNKEIEDEELDVEPLEQLEITKEQIKPRTAEEIKKIKKIDNADLDDNEDADEKNLYDLIDMMYDSE